MVSFSNGSMYNSLALKGLLLSQANIKCLNNQTLDNNSTIFIQILNLKNLKFLK